MQASRPFTYRDGAPGLAFVKAAYAGGALPDSMAERLSQASGVAVVFIDVRQLLPLPANSQWQLSISTITDLPQAANAIPADTPLAVPQILLRQQQTLAAPGHTLPYVLQLSMSPPNALQWLLLAGAGLMGAGLLSRQWFYRPVRPPGPPPSPPAPQPRAALEHIALQAMDEAVLLLSARSQILYANARAMVLTGDNDLPGKLLAGADFGICYPRNQRRVHVLPRLIEKKCGRCCRRAAS
ncbi:hypothetical protein ACFSQE_17595 [Vogesella fluminis]|uniref:hypothetical protein n=1 Tax=Vogesella fluminis TaxID=1069161 RepID=UPI00363301E6